MNQAVIASVDGILHSGIDFGVFDGKTVLISGANGFVPSYLAYALLERNRRYDSKTKLILLCRNLERANTRFAEYLFDPHLELLIQDAWGRVKSEEKTHYVICAASPAGIQSRQANSLFTYETNLFGTKNALDYAKEHGCERFLFISSVDVYGKLCDTGRLSEDNLGYLDMFYPRNAYSNGKRSAETICSLYFDGHGLQTVIARPFQIYGPGMSLNDGRLHGDLIGQIKNTGKITLKSDGTAKRSFMYIRDAAEALFSILLKGLPGRAYNICDEQSEATVLELANLYKKIVNGDVDVGFEKNIWIPQK